MTNLQQTKQISIRDYLTQRGIKPKQQNTRYGLYLSPLREEHSPSFKVDYIQNLWYDFGLGEGGSIIDLVMRLEQCDLTQAVRLLNSGERTQITVPEISSVVPTVPRLRILSDTPLHHPSLLDYLQRRGIVTDIARTYCREVCYTTSGRAYFAIGFLNDAGGWELRSEHFKGCASPKQITTVDSHANTVIAFEGFMDFLSYLTLKKAEQLRIDAVVLNSVVNVGKAIPFLQRHRTVHTFFDNDEAGRRATAQVRQLAPTVEVVDQASFYRDHNDLNDYLKSRQPIKEKKQSHGLKF